MMSNHPIREAFHNYITQFSISTVTSIFLNKHHNNFIYLLHTGKDVNRFDSRPCIAIAVPNTLIHTYHHYQVLLYSFGIKRWGIYIPIEKETISTYGILFDDGEFILSSPNYTGIQWPNEEGNYLEYFCNLPPSTLYDYALGLCQKLGSNLDPLSSEFLVKVLSDYDVRNPLVSSNDLQPIVEFQSGSRENLEYEFQIVAAAFPSILSNVRVGFVSGTAPNVISTIFMSGLTVRHTIVDRILNKVYENNYFTGKEARYTGGSKKRRSSYNYVDYEIILEKEECPVTKQLDYLDKFRDWLPLNFNQKDCRDFLRYLG